MTQDLAISFSNSWNDSELHSSAVVQEAFREGDFHVLVHFEGTICDSDLQYLFNLLKTYPSFSYYICSPYRNSPGVDLIIF